MKIAIAMLILACTCLPGCTGQPPNESPSLYEDFGGRKAIEQVVDLTIRRSHNDPRISFHFDNTDDASFGEILFEQLCNLAAGPCQYDGMAMDEAHLGFGVTKADFDIFVQIVIDAMEDVGIPFSAQNRMLALLAPMRAEIVDK